MKKIVLFLGAGASVPFGIPLTRDIFPRIIDGLTRRTLSNRSRQNAYRMPELYTLLTRLLPGLTQEKAGLPSITDVLSLIDQMILSGNAPYRGAQLDDLVAGRRNLEWAICQVIRRPPRLKKNSQALLERLGKWIVGTALDGGTKVCLVSTNYDTVVEHTILEMVRSRTEAFEEIVDFGVDWRDTQRYVDRVYRRPQEARLALFKLHGSLDWLKCDLCEQIYVNDEQPIVSQAFRQRIDDNNSCWCGHGRLRPIMVAPSTVRDIREGILLAIWREALEQMRTATMWVMVGYSLPPEDTAIRSLLIRAYQGHQDWPDNPARSRIRVIQHGPGEEPRYRMLFPHCEYSSGGVESYIVQLN